MSGRNHRMLRASALVCALLSLAGCAAFVSKSDYADYRAVRMEQRDDQRLRAMQRYVTRHPDGRWYGEVQRERRARDRDVFESGRADRAGLELYLAAFPDGEFTTQARSRLAAIEVIEQRKREEAQLAARMADERRAREQELSRTWVTRFFGYWINTLVSLQGWGSPIADVARGNADFSRAFGRPPRPRCSAEECVKFYDSAYAVPVPGGTRLERTMRLVLRLRMDDGKLSAAELLLPGGGFSRWQELEERRAVVEGDTEARAQAVAWALGRVVPLIDKLAPDRTEIASYQLSGIPKLTFGPTGELTDTTAEDPSAPANRIQGTGDAAETPEPSAEELVKPQAPEPAADMEMETLQVGKDGRAHAGSTQAPADPTAAAQADASAGSSTATGQELVLEPLAVPRADGSPSTAAPAGTAAPDGSTTAAPAAGAAPATTVRAFRSGGLRIVLFAGAPGGFDGVLIERASDAKPAAQTGRRKAGAGRPANAPATAPPAPAAH